MSIVVFQFSVVIPADITKKVIVSIEAIRKELHSMAKDSVKPVRLSDYAFYSSWGSAVVDAEMESNFCDIGLDIPFIGAKGYRVQIPMLPDNVIKYEFLCEHFEILASVSLLLDPELIPNDGVKSSLGIPDTMIMTVPVYRYHNCNSHARGECEPWIILKYDNTVNWQKQVESSLQKRMLAPISAITLDINTSAKNGAQ